jgi:PLP dependent protein
LSIPVNDRDTLARLEERIASVRERIATAAERAHRGPEDVRLVAATKQVEPHVVELAVRAGLKEFGENYAQELETKRDAAPDAVWHFLGRLQRNKVRRILEGADVIHTLEPGGSAERLLNELPENRPGPSCLIEVDFTGKRVGVDPDGLDAFADAVVEAGGDLRGLMTVAPLEEDPRPWFARLRELGARLQTRHPHATELSMGMSTDLEVAVEEGATMVRVGEAIFGPRARR